MARQHETSAQPWGTLEELLLVCAVNRHGPKSWDSIAMEVQNRTTSFAPTAHDCRDKFDDLKRRFKSQNDNQSHSLVPMVDELRRLRVEELRREVRRRDVSIVSLELKVKKLEEERERSLKEEAEARLTDDPQRGQDEKEASPENLAGKTNSGEDFGSDSDVRENRSFNESNSTSQRGEAKANGAVGKQAEEEEAAEPDRNQPDPVRTGIRSEPERDCSVYGKVIDDDDDEDNNKNKNKKGDTVGARREKESRLGESNESMGDSKREGKGGGVASSKQNSDVQSSASLSKRKRRRRGGGGGGEGGGSSSGEEPEGDEVSPATKRVKLVKLEPLVKVLRIIHSHPLGSVFERRLRSQESGRYKNLIRQHMDLHAVQSRLDKGVYTDCTHMFFRDLLIVFSNAVVFFRKTSPEHLAAQELRSLVLKEMNDQLPKPQPTTTLKSKPKIESDSAPLKPRKSSIVEFGKRCSVNALPEDGANNKKKKGDKKERGGVEEKAKADEKKMDDSFVKIEDKDIRKKRTQERVGRRGTRSSSKNTDKTKHEYGGNELSSHDGLEVVKMEKKESVKKKQGAASFLKRMKQNSPSTKVRGGNSDDDSEDDSKDSMVEEEDEKDGEKEKKKKGTKKLDGRRERVTRSSTGNGGGRGGGRREESGRAKRGVGRPPKRPESAGARSGKRGRDNGESDQVGSAGRPRKRTRR